MFDMPSPEASRRNLAKVRRLRSAQESLIVKRFVWQWVLQTGPKPTQRQLARELGVRQTYVREVAGRWGKEGMPVMLGNPQRVTFEDLAKARARRSAD